jgi:hypothetical protein
MPHNGILSHIPLVTLIMALSISLLSTVYLWHVEYSECYISRLEYQMKLNVMSARIP